MLIGNSKFPISRIYVTSDANGENDDVPVGELVKSREGNPKPIPIGIDNMINRSFLLPPNEDGSRQRALITGVVEDFQGQLDSNPDRVRYKARIGESKFEELIQLLSRIFA